MDDESGQADLSGPKGGDGKPSRFSGLKDWRLWRAPLVCIVLTVLLYTLAFAPHNRFEAAFVFLTPFITWAMFRPGLCRFAAASFVASLLCWCFSISWLVNLGEHLAKPWQGAVCLVGCSLIFTPWLWIWFLLLHRVMARAVDRPFWGRLLGLLCLSAAWVILEWARENLLMVQWNTLSSALWQQPALLQVASITGAWGLSFYLVFFNLGITVYVRSLVIRGTRKRPFIQRFCPEFYILFGILGLMIWLFFRNLDNSREREPMFRAGVVQPDIPQDAKADPKQTGKILLVLQEIMQDLRLDEVANPPDLFLWPETATPVEAAGNTPEARDIGRIISQLVKTSRTPLLMGNMRADEVKVILRPKVQADPTGNPLGSLDLEGVNLKGLGIGFPRSRTGPKVHVNTNSTEGTVTARTVVNRDGTADLVISDNGKFRAGESAVVWFTSLYNGIFHVDPESGISESFYAKQRLVPFGEFVPLGRYLPFLGKIVPIPEEFLRGQSSVQLPVTTRRGKFMAGPLVCYEDVFSAISREHAASGADFLFVATNDGWYGKGGAAYQHAAHSVLRAIETRRPVLRCGNNGWSGWINELGVVRQFLHDKAGSIYIQGRMVMDVRRARAFAGRQTFFVRHGDWFVVLCAVFVLAGLLVFRGNRKPRPEKTQGPPN